MSRVNEGVAQVIRDGVGRMQAIAFATSTEKGFHDGPLDRSDAYNGLRIALIHDEASECLRELRADEISWEKVADELADIVLRCADLAATHGLDLGAAVVAKMRRNELRERMHGGKRF